MPFMLFKLTGRHANTSYNRVSWLIFGFIVIVWFRLLRSFTQQCKLISRLFPAWLACALCIFSVYRTTLITSVRRTGLFSVINAINSTTVVGPVSWSLRSCVCVLDCILDDSGWRHFPPSWFIEKYSPVDAYCHATMSTIHVSDAKDFFFPKYERVKLYLSSQSSV